MASKLLSYCFLIWPAFPASVLSLDFPQLQMKSFSTDFPGRMREKLLKYAPPHPKGFWPFCSNILDAVRCSIVCPDAAAMLQV